MSRKRQMNERGTRKRALFSVFSCASFCCPILIPFCSVKNSKLSPGKRSTFVLFCLIALRHILLLQKRRINQKRVRQHSQLVKTVKIASGAFAYRSFWLFSV